MFFRSLLDDPDDLARHNVRLRPVVVRSLIGAGDLASPPEFIIADPDLAQLEELFSIADPRSEADADDDEV